MSLESEVCGFVEVHRDASTAVIFKSVCEEAMVIHYGPSSLCANKTMVTIRCWISYHPVSFCVSTEQSISSHITPFLRVIWGCTHTQLSTHTWCFHSVTLGNDDDAYRIIWVANCCVQATTIPVVPFLESVKKNNYLNTKPWHG